MTPAVEVEVRRNRHGSVLAYADRDRASRLLADHRAVLHALYDLVDRRHGADGETVARIVVREDLRVVDEIELCDRFQRELDPDRAISLVEDLRYHAGERELVTDGGVDQPDREVEHFNHAGLDCKIVKTDLGHWCGYVRRPESVEPVRWTGDYDAKRDEMPETEVDVWGGITYGPDDEGWVGFDDAHATPLVDESSAKTDEEAVKNETENLAEQIAEITNNKDADHGSGDGEGYTDGGYIEPILPIVESKSKGGRNE